MFHDQYSGLYEVWHGVWMGMMLAEMANPKQTYWMTLSISGPTKKKRMRMRRHRKKGRSA